MPNLDKPVWCENISIRTQEFDPVAPKAHQRPTNPTKLRIYPAVLKFFRWKYFDLLYHFSTLSTRVAGVLSSANMFSCLESSTCSPNVYSLFFCITDERKMKLLVMT
ncbi:hypothetical protein YC2023_111315 [Brassica napus]